MCFLLKFSGICRTSVFALQSYKAVAGSVPEYEWSATDDAKECERPIGLLAESESQENIKANLENHTSLHLLDHFVGKK